jgi:hypothetical protein
MFGKQDSAEGAVLGEKVRPRRLLDFRTVEALTQFLFLFLQVTETEFLDKLHQLTARLEEQDLALAILKVRLPIYLRVSMSTYSRSDFHLPKDQPVHQGHLLTYSKPKVSLSRVTVWVSLLPTQNSAHLLQVRLPIFLWVRLST